MTKSEQRRADAIADAETLRRVALELNGHGRLHGTALWVVRAAWSLNEHVRHPFTSGRKHARAAFRAVPALRGDR